MLIASKLKSLKPKAKPYKVSDEKGLYVLVNPTGSLLWRFNYRFSGKQKTLALGKFPDISLLQARLKRDKARSLLAEGKDPGAKIIKNTFETLAREWYSKKRHEWKNTKHANQVINTLEQYVFPFIGNSDMNAISPPELLEIFEKMENRGILETTRRTYQRVSAVFDYAVITGKCKYNPAASLSRALKTPKSKNLRSLPPKMIKQFMLDVTNSKLTKIAKLALQFTAHTFLRQGNVVGALREEIDFKNKIMVIPADKMKKPKDHIVPLTNQVISIVKNAYEVVGDSDYIFTANGEKPLSSNALVKALKSLGYHEHTTLHGFRTTASTILYESGLFNGDWIELQLAHAERNKVKGAYNKAQYLEGRRKMMQWWSDHIAGDGSGDG